MVKILLNLLLNYSPGLTQSSIAIESVQNCYLRYFIDLEYTNKNLLTCCFGINYITK